MRLCLEEVRRCREVLAPVNLARNGVEVGLGGAAEILVRELGALGRQVVVAGVLAVQEQARAAISLDALRS
jgi:hypothetical protein